MGGAGREREVVGVHLFEHAHGPPAAGHVGRAPQPHEPARLRHGVGGEALPREQVSRLVVERNFFQERRRPRRAAGWIGVEGREQGRDGLHAVADHAPRHAMRGPDHLAAMHLQAVVVAGDELLHEHRV